MARDELPRTSENKSVVTIHFPEGRAFLWPGMESPVTNWRVGDAVFFRNSPWVVLDRTEDGESLSLTLGVAA
ncbi:MAG: hypothetical protein ACRDLU_07910 [Gaiellaceae bacterium]